MLNAIKTLSVVCNYKCIVKTLTFSVRMDPEVDGNVKNPRLKKFRDKKAAENPRFKKEESNRINELQKKARAKETDEAKEIRKTKNKLRMREKRENERLRKQGKIKITNDALSPKSRHERKFGYRTKDTLQKAVKKITEQTPRCPKKKKAVIMKLALDAGLEVSPKDSVINEDPPTPKPHALALSEELVEKVTKFFLRSDVVWTSPSVKDEMTLWDDSGKKYKLRKYYLEMTVDEAFALFKKENPNEKIGRSKFYELKPKNVLLMKDSPADQCKCAVHETYRMLLVPFKIETTNKDFWTNILCNTSDLKNSCWKNQCEDCKDGIKLLQWVRQNKATGGMVDSSKVKWYVWENQQSLTKSGKPINRQVKTMKEGFPNQLIEIIEKEYPSYLEHVRRKRIMHNEYQDDLSKEGNVIIQCDFAMDYNCQDNANEIQSAIYGRRNVTIFTCAVYIEKKCHSYAVLTDADKYKSTVRLCLLRILQDVLLKFDIAYADRLIIWSDGPSNEFRNQYVTGKLLHEIMCLIKKPCTWKYFETSHGKGVCDGIGGTLKSCVRRHVKGKHRDSVVVQDYTEFYKVAKPYVPEITLLLLKQKDVEDSLLTKPWDSSKPIAGVSKCHVSKCHLTGKVTVFYLPGEDELSTVSYDNVGGSSSQEELQQPVLPVAPPSEIISVKKGCWYKAEFTDGNNKANYLVQLLSVCEDKESVVVQSYLSSPYQHYTSNMKTCFKKHPGPCETVRVEDILCEVPSPTDFPKGGKVLFERPVNGVK